MIFYIFSDDEPRRPGQRLPTSMLGNEVIIITILIMMIMIIISIHIVILMVIIMVMVINLVMVIIMTLNYDQVMSKEQLYDLFQQILNVKKFEHQLLYNAMQVIIISIVALEIVIFIVSIFLKDTIVTHHMVPSKKGEKPKICLNRSEQITASSLNIRENTIRIQKQRRTW